MKTLLTLTLCLASLSGVAFAQDAKSECCELDAAQIAVAKAACADTANCAKAGKKAGCADCKNPGKCADAANCAKAGNKADCAGGSCEMMSKMKGGQMRAMMMGGPGMNHANAKVMVKVMTMDENGNMVEINPSEMGNRMEWIGRHPSGNSRLDIQKMIEVEVKDMKGNFMFRGEDGDEIHGLHMIQGGEMEWDGHRISRDGLEKRMIRVEVGGEKGNFIIMGEDGDQEHVLHRGHDVEMEWDGRRSNQDDLEARISAIEKQLSRIERMLKRMAG